VRRILALFFSALLLWSLIAITNHYLAPWHVYLFVGGLFVTFAALQMPLRAGLYASLLAGLLCDAGAGTRFGLHAVLFGLVHGFVFNFRGRLDRGSTVVQVVVALLANVALFLGLSFTQTGALPVPGAAWLRLLWDLLWSQLAIALLAPWFFAVQRRALVLADPLTAFLERRESE
jgi:rod shape-determining protein MreD